MEKRIVKKTVPARQGDRSRVSLVVLVISLVVSVVLLAVLYVMFA